MLPVALAKWSLSQGPNSNLSGTLCRGLALLSGCGGTTWSPCLQRRSRCLCGLPRRGERAGCRRFHSNKQRSSPGSARPRGKWGLGPEATLFLPFCELGLPQRRGQGKRSGLPVRGGSHAFHGIQVVGLQFVKGFGHVARHCFSQVVGSSKEVPRGHPSYLNSPT